MAEIEIAHEAPAAATVGERLTLDAAITDDAAGIDLVRAYFKSIAATDFVYAKMTRVDGESDLFTTTLPAPSTDAQRIDYFLLVRNVAGAVVKSQNFVVDVNADPERDGEDASGGDVVIEPAVFAPVEGFHGRMLRIGGDVTVVNTYGESRTPAEAGYVVRKFETVHTGRSGVVVLDFDQDPLTVLDNDSRLNVRTPTWFSHLAGKAYFAFQRLFGVGDEERVVNNTVALIGIRGTTFISYDGATKGVALKEGSLRIARSRPRPLSLLRDGVARTTSEFTLGPERLAVFDGAQVTESGFTPAVSADFARLEAFAAGLAGLPQTAGQPRTDVFSEASTPPSQVTGFSDYIVVRPTPADAILGISATESTVVASTGAAASGTSPWLIAAAGVGAALAVSNADTGGGGGSSGTSGGSGDDTPSRSNFVGTVTLTCNTCRISFTDTNSIQDDFYDLYVNDQFVGAVNNTPGGAVMHTANFLSGANTMELRFTVLQCCNTDLEADFNNGEAITPFTGTADHVWTVTAP